MILNKRREAGDAERYQKQPEYLPTWLDGVARRDDVQDQGVPDQEAYTE
jgi:hypothetical protein